MEDTLHTITPGLRKIAAAFALSVPMLLSAPMASAAPAPVTSIEAASFVAPAASGPRVLVLAADQNRNSPEAALKALQGKVADNIKGNKYPLEGGGFATGSDLLDKKDGQINQAVYNQLSRQGKKAFIGDVAGQTQKYTNPSVPDYDGSLAKSNGVDESTQSNWFQQLRNTPGVGTQMLTEVLRNGVHADLTTGATWFKPFSGPLSGFLGFMAIVVVTLMGIRSVIDLSYISLPYFQTAYDKVEAGWGGGGTGHQGGSGGKGGIKVISAAARRAADDSEKGGNPIWSYFKSAAFEYIVLGLAILFLCFNYMWDFTGTILDVGMGLLGY